MKRMRIAIVVGLFLLLPELAQSQAIERRGGKLQPTDLRITQLEMSPDPVREGQWVSFEVTVSNLSNHSGRVSFFIKDRDEGVSEVQNVQLQPGRNRVSFPRTNYRFSRGDHCFIVEADIERTRRPMDTAKEFCAARTYTGWSLNAPRVGPLFVEDLDMSADPARPGQDVRFRVRLRNDGQPLKADIRIQDRDETVAKLNDVLLSRGYGEYPFPFTRYQFQRFDHCFVVIVDVERTPYRIDASREFCAKPLGWTLK